MRKIGLFWGSDTGNTEEAAQKIMNLLGADRAEQFDIGDVNVEKLIEYDKLILGTSTWYDGEFQSDWENVFPQLDEIDFSGKSVAFFGLGDQYGYDDYFVDAMGILHDKIKERGASVVGKWPVVGYDFEESKAQNGDHFIGLALDEDNQSELSDERIKSWVNQILNEWNLQEK